MPPATYGRYVAKRIFISYRRDDSAGQTGRLRDILVEQLGDDCVFLDVDNIPLGANFIEELKQEVASCALLFVIIGNQWLSLRDRTGRRRIDNPGDSVRLEVVTALQKNIPVVPILLDGTEIPAADALPMEMKELAFRNGIEINHPTFRADVERLVHKLKPQVGNKRRLSTFEVLLFSFCNWLLFGALAIAIVAISFVPVATLPDYSPSAVRWILFSVAIGNTLFIALVSPPVVAIRLRRAKTWSWPKAWMAIGSSAALFGMFGGMLGSEVGFLAVNVVVSFCWLVLFAGIKRR
jgi:hypothetical protein